MLYIGRAGDLRRRVASYWGNLGDRRHLTRMVPQITRLEALVCASEHEAAWLERNLLEHRMPRWNRVVGGMEVPVFIRLRRSPVSATLDIVHGASEQGGGRLFGPYLGGNRVRLAVSALDRILPLGYAADRRGGFARDMARIRGVTPAGRDGMVEMIVGVLERQPAALRIARDALLASRDAASRAQAYELAARVQAEMDGLDWVVEDQRVTRSDDQDADVHGWADGILVSFEVRAGRMVSWQERACTEVAAIDHVAATPSEWAPFAACNAALAARLSA
jgi:excinuclease ABC subunit C